MTKRRGDDRPEYRVLGYPTVALVAVLVVAGGTGLAIWLLAAFGSGSETDRGRMEAIKTAGTIVLGSGGLVALWLAVRRQRTTEIALKQKDREHDHAERDAAERRVTELYTKAVEQLGSDKAPVRLGGMYALERLAQNVPEQRQTIVNVLCAYLRMPYLPPSATESASDEAAAREVQEENKRRTQEREVRLTAQRILATHLRPGDDPAHPDEAFWPGIDLDLTGATLLNFDFSGCHIHTAEFAGAQFHGDAWFYNTQFNGNAEFHRTQFSEIAMFEEARFNKLAEFGEAQFNNLATFERAQFNEDASFSGAQFIMNASFVDAKFSKPAEFDKAQFNEVTLFTGTQFGEDSWFDGTQFNGNTWFDETQFGEDTRFSGAQFNGEADFTGARVRLDVVTEVERVWPDNYVVAEPGSEEDARLPEHEGRWGYLVQANAEEPSSPTT